MKNSETSAKLNLTPGKYPKENIQIIGTIKHLRVIYSQIIVTETIKEQAVSKI
jgi:hypothetical protein